MRERSWCSSPWSFILAGALVFLRLVPWIVRFLIWAGSRVEGVVLFLGLRQMGRRAGPFTGLMILLMLTFATGTFSASMAATINRNLEDSAYYQIGADAFFEEYGEFDDAQQIWHMPPIEGHLDATDGGAPAVDRVARLWRDDAVVRLLGGTAGLLPLGDALRRGSGSVCPNCVVAPRFRTRVI